MAHWTFLGVGLFIGGGGGGGGGGGAEGAGAKL